MSEKDLLKKIEEFQKSEERYKAILENQTELICKYTKGGILTFVNKSYCEYFGKTKEELEGNSFFPKIPDDDLKILNKNIKSLTPENPIIKTKHRVILNDEIRWQEWIDRAFFDESGNVIEYQSVGRDITHHIKQINELETIINSSPIIIFLWKNEIGWPVEFVSENITQFGYTQDDFYSAKIPYAIIIHNSDLERVIKEIEYYSKNKFKTFKQKYRIYSKNHKVLWIDDRTLVRYDENGEITHFQGIILNITKEKEIEEILIAQSRQVAMGDMVAMIAHQWRQPISTIGMSVNNMLVDVELNDIKKEEFKTRLNSINEQVTYLSKTIDDFRNFFKPDKEKEMEKLSIILQFTLNIIGQSLENNGINVKISIEDRELRVYVNELVQIFLNIISNAKDILKLKEIEKPTIVINSFSENDNYIVKICDNAGGVDEKYINKIFEPYFTTKEFQNGTGLGLYMSKIIMEKHLNGSIFVKNKEDGACFYCKFNLNDI